MNNEKLKNAFWDVWDDLLGQPGHGVDKQSFDKLVELGQLIDPMYLRDVIGNVNENNGRFYL